MALSDNTDLHLCLCCGQRVEERGKPVTPERAIRAVAALEALGFTKDALLTKHRAQIDYQSPGLAEWLIAEARRTTEWH
jgi:hypothetical protein